MSRSNYSNGNIFEQFLFNLFLLPLYLFEAILTRPILCRTKVQSISAEFYFSSVSSNSSSSSSLLHGLIGTKSIVIFPQFKSKKFSINALLTNDFAKLEANKTWIVWSK